MINDDIDAVDVDAALGFEPAVSTTGADDVSSPTGRRTTRTSSRSGLRRRLGAGVVLLSALTAMGGAYAAFATSSGAETNAASASDIAAGQSIFQNSCISCHGANLQGVKSQGPPLAGVGGAAVYFQVTTGRMPVPANGAYVAGKPAKFDEKQTQQLAAYVQSIGGGPNIPQGNLQVGSDEIAEGGALYRLNCASCHGATGGGAPLAAGAVAPSLRKASDKIIYSAMLSGPENMPVFSDNSVTPLEKRSIITYLRTLQNSEDPGGSGIDRIGPVSEAIVIWTAGVGLLMASILWIGARAR
ncbi:MAG: cytochrome c [Jatrophihabitans sp.]